MKNSKKFMTGILALLFLSSLSLANGFNLNGLGARAVAMGGAFVGLADDYSAIFWNPAGIANFTTKYFGFSGTDILPSGTYELTIPPPYGAGTVVDAKTMTKHYLAGLAAYYHPISQNLVAGIGVYTPSGLGANWDGADYAFLSNNRTDIEWMSKVGIVTISPALAYKINEMFSVGVALNINYGMFDVKTYAGKMEVIIPVPPYALSFDLGQHEESMSGWGYGATLGILVKPSPKFSLGATFKTGSTIKFDGEAIIPGLTELAVIGYPFKEKSSIKREVTWPMWIAAGVAFKPVERLTLTADVQYTNWKKIDVIKTEFIDTMWQEMMRSSGENERAMNWKDSTQIRFGAEFKATKAIAVRAGYYLDPSPAPDTTMNVLLPSYDFNGVAFGVGYALNGLQIDFGLEYLTGKEREISFLRTFYHPLNPLFDEDYEGAQPGVYNMKIIVPQISVSYKF